MTPTRSPFLAALAVAVAALVLAPAAAALAAGDDVTWTVRTASNDFGADRTSYSYTVEPGSSVQDALVVANHGTDPLTLGVYAADGYTTASGQFDLVAAGTKSVAVGTWVRSTSSSVTVDPGATVQVPFTVTVPRNATPGDYAGGILTSLVRPDASDTINVDRRLGIRIALRVGGDLRPAVAVENPHVDFGGGLNPFAGGDATVTYTIHNTGNAVVSARQSTAVAGPFGWFAAGTGRVAEVPRLLPGEKWTVTVPAHDVAAAGLVVATATVTPVVIDASGSTSTLDPVTATATGAAIPWMLLVLLLVVAAAVVGVLLLRRRARARQDARVQEAVDRALAEAEAAPKAGVGS